MSRAIDRIEKIAGASIGNIGDPLAPFQTSLEAKGLPVPGDRWIWEIRSGLRQGGRMIGRWERLGVASKNDSSNKDRLYRRFATEAVSIRTFGNNFFSRKYTSERFMPDVAHTFQMNEKDASRALRAMRVDLVYGYQENPDLEGLHQRIVEDYFRGNIESLPPSLRRRSVLRLYEEWDRRSIPSFYRAFYQAMHSSVRAIGGFAPYEVELMQRFYEGRTKVKTPSQPTLFDTKVFEVNGDADAVVLAVDLRRELKMPINRNNIFVHRNALVFGTTRADSLSKANPDA